jgi:hypothetical protein
MRACVAHAQDNYDVRIYVTHTISAQITAAASTSSNAVASAVRSR